jgi:hypothetical protein
MDDTKLPNEVPGFQVWRRETMGREVEMCWSCDGEVRMMTRKGTGYCSEKCFDAGLNRDMREALENRGHSYKWKFGKWVKVDG